MRYLKVCLLFLFFISAITLEAQQTIYVPWSPDEHYVLSIENEVVVVKNGEKHILASTTIKGIYVPFAKKLGLNLYGFERIALDGKIATPDYKYKKDQNDYFCHECKGRFSMFVPYHDIDRIIFKKPEIAEIYLKGIRNPMYAYVYGIDISG